MQTVQKKPQDQLAHLREHLDLDPAVLDAAHEACAGTWLDPFDLIDWLIAAADADWMRPQTVRRWAAIIVAEGRLPGCG